MFQGGRHSVVAFDGGGAERPLPGLALCAAVTSSQVDVQGALSPIPYCHILGPVIAVPKKQALGSAVGAYENNLSRGEGKVNILSGERQQYGAVGPPAMKRFSNHTVHGHGKKGAGEDVQIIVEQKHPPFLGFTRGEMVGIQRERHEGKHGHKEEAYDDAPEAPETDSSGEPVKVGHRVGRPSKATPDPQKPKHGPDEQAFASETENPDFCGTAFRP